MRRCRWRSIGLATLLLLAGCRSADESTATIYEPVVINTFPHDTAAYTQGLQFHDGLLLEGTGQVGESSLRWVEPATGRIVASMPTELPIFGEGVTIVGDEIWQLSWRDEVALVHSLDLVEQRRVPYEGEGWGLCATDERFVMSNGSDRLTFRDLSTFEEIGSVRVSLDGEPVDRLNELECVDDRVWANVWKTDDMLSIDPDTGSVDGVVRLTSLTRPEFLTDPENVPNGIAYDHDTERFWLTGKRWPVIYEVELREVGPSTAGR